MAGKEPILQLDEISKAFPGVQALDAVSLAIYPGEVHAIIGENGAGKSTLMNILAGELQPDSGRIIYQGVECTIAAPFVSQQMGINVVYQELALCPNLSVAENISLNTASTSRALAFVDRNAFLTKAREMLGQLGMEQLDPKVAVGQMGVAEQQIVEIAKAISTEVKVLILDEPNSALTKEETAHLFKVLRDLRQAGVAIIYISHRLEEVLQLADQITVLRDGRFIETIAAENATEDYLITRMVGRQMESLYKGLHSDLVTDKVSFSVRNLHSGDDLKELSFEVKAGEIVGIAGLPGAGKGRLVECCFGLRNYSGDIEIEGQPVSLNTPDKAIKHGLALIPADRRSTGAMQVLSVQDNIVAASLGDVSKLGFLQQALIRLTSKAYVEQLDIRIASLAQKMRTLSGGNQQKVILARGLATQPKVFILHEPTRGIDVGAKAEIYSLLQDLANKGAAILIVSSELPELLGQCHRIIVLFEGRITGHFMHEEATEEAILACAMGRETHVE